MPPRDRLADRSLDELQVSATGAWAPGLVGEPARPTDEVAHAVELISPVLLGGVRCAVQSDEFVLQLRQTGVDLGAGGAGGGGSGHGALRGRGGCASVRAHAA
jgi:hypothetical protein